MSIVIAMVKTQIKLSGYSTTEQIYSSNKTLVYKGIRCDDLLPVVIKIMHNEYPSFQEIVQLHNQYTITKNLDIPGIVKPISLEVYGNGYVLIMEDFGGISLKNYISDILDSGLISLTEFLHIAIQITHTLHQLHTAGIIHKDIKPANILINPSTGQVKLIDFSISSLLPRETQQLQSPDVLEGTLAYISPEQTGRMNRGIDYRTDFYSLGVTFFELLTGQLPFHADDPMELVHCHIAKQPDKFKIQNSKFKNKQPIPEVLCNIVMKLMEKNAENRYQSALGLKYDLEACQHQYQQTGNIINFILGTRDSSHRFLIPEKLYGRETEVKNLLQAFDRVSAGNTEMMLVAGFSGIGKTAVVHEVHKPIVKQRGYFIQGKYDQFTRNLPFSAIVQAFRDLIGQLLTENKEQVKQWKNKILAAVGENCQVIIDVIPEVELLIGKQPCVSELTGSAAQNRFNLVFQKFVQIFPSPEHPLVIFLDDLQWADAASLKLIQLLISETDTQCLLLIGAYRDNEVSMTHPLMLMIEEIRQAGANINTINLAPLNHQDLNHLIADTLNCSQEEAEPLEKLIYTKTQGNPFFSHQFLKSLHEDGLITLNLEAKYWQYDIAQLQRLSLTDNVVEFVALQLQKLPAKTQELLRLAACIGNEFDLNTLAIVYDKSLVDTAADLWKALQEGLILPQNEIYKLFQDETADYQLPQVNQNEQLDIQYKFLHDRVQQAAYLLIPEAAKQTTHLKIGQLLLTNLPIEEREERIFEIVNHLNIGSALLCNETEIIELANLNLIAGHKARVSTAYGSAITYLNQGLALLTPDSWDRYYDLTLNLHREAIEAEYLNTNFQGAIALTEIVLQKANSLMDRVRVYELKMQIYIAQLDMLKAIDTGLMVLEMLEVTLENSPPPPLVVEDLVNLPEMTDTKQLAAMKILVALISPTYFVNPGLLAQIVFTQIHLSRYYGNSAQSAYSYVLYGLMLCGLMGDIDTGYRYGQLALKLLDQFNAKELKCKILMVFNGNISLWKEHIKLTLEPLQLAMQSGLETGDIEYACYANLDYLDPLLAIDENLVNLEEKIHNYCELMISLKQEYPINNNKILWQFVLNLLGRSQNPLHLCGEVFDEKEMLPLFRAAQHNSLLLFTYLRKGQLSYLFKAYDQAVKNLQLGAEFLESSAGMLRYAEHNFYYSLALLALYHQVDSSTEKEQYLQQVTINQAKMKDWAYHAPCNFKHKYELVEAEWNRIQGNNLAAMELYDNAIAGAKESGYICEAALASELTAEFYQSLGRDYIASTYLTDAYYTYARWGAKAKVEDLEKCYPHYLTSILNRETSNLSMSVKNTSNQTGNRTVSSLNGSSLLDLTSVIKASQAISSEIRLEKLLTKLMQVVIENAGAQIGCLLLSKDDHLMMAAQLTSDDTDVNQLKIIFKQEIPFETSQEIPVKLINYVAQTGETLILQDATKETRFATDSYIIQQQPKSILCIPIHKLQKLIGILYLENNLTTDAFTAEGVSILQLLTSQAAMCLENAMLYENLAQANQRLEDYNRTLEQKVAEKTQDLAEAFAQLKRTQAQMVQGEKMSSLGQMVAGIAHEINNPINFIHGNIPHINDYVEDLLELLQAYQDNLINPPEIIQKLLDEIDIDFLSQDLNKILKSIKIGTQRIQEIVLSLRNFSRLDEAEFKAADIHQGIDNTLMILHHRLKAQPHRPEIQVIKQYGQLPLVDCYAGQLNQVFMNLLSNAIDALEESMKTANKQLTTPSICIHTEITPEHKVLISIADNGLGIPEAIRSKLFDPFFTTKPVGKGTGLGLSISYQIVQEKHGGKLWCDSTLNQGTKFMIEIPIVNS
ncbi:MAG TPA: AAA family ATPase [Nostocaceae cyanobacterium]|nr:AAA family ATPase [Nostocaceae cyanobacterium]